MLAPVKQLSGLQRIEAAVVTLVSEPLTWVAAGLFFNISGVTDYSPALRGVESAIFLAGICAAAIRLWFGSTKEIAQTTWLPFIGLAGFGLLLASLGTSVLNGQNLSVLDDFGWKHFAKFILLVTMGLMVYPAGYANRVLQPVIYGALAILAVSVLIRFHGFQEFNPETGRMELSGRHGDPNFACMFMTIGMLYALYHLAVARKRSLQLFHSAMIGLFLGTAWFTESRAGLAVLTMAFASALFVMPLNRFRKPLIVIVSASVVLAIVFAGERLLERYLTIADASNSGRIAGILAIKDMLLAQPLWGHGFDSSSTFVQRYLDVKFVSDTVALEIHMTPLQIAGELGLTGLVAYGLIYGGTFYLLVNEAVRRRSLRPHSTLVALVTFTILANMVSIPMTYIGTVHGIMLVLLAGLLASKKTV